MKISYNWLKRYVNVDVDAEELSKILTNTGLEVEGLEKYESVKGGLEGVVVGEVLTCVPHPNSDHLHITEVNVGASEPLHIVCGAPNVAAGQKVLVATLGTKLYDGDTCIEIKKSKIRGEESFGMLCAEDELGLGTSHDGIMVLDGSIAPGTLAKDIFDIENDYIFEIGLTPNRADAISHLGVARDVVAAYYERNDVKLERPSVDNFKVDEHSVNVSVEVANDKLCPRYTGLAIKGIKIQESPSWLQNRLKAIGLQPINNVVDVTNFILHELGQPLHAFDLDKIKGNKIVVKTCPEKTKFVTLDKVERELSADDLMICNADEPMCMAGVFGGLESGISDSTTSVFIESAYFNPVSIRKTARRHGLNTDASFRYERGIDPNITTYALKRAALLIKEVAGGSVACDIIDTHPEVFEDFAVTLSYNKVNRLIGKVLDKSLVKKILTALDIKIVDESNEELSLMVPPYRVDVIRPEDVIEEILRIYGYNNVEIPTMLNASIVYKDGVDAHKLQNTISNMLVANGMNEVMCNSLTKGEYFEKLESVDNKSLVYIINPLSTDLNVLRKTLMFGMLESVRHNINRKNQDLKLFEFGSSYHKGEAVIAIERYSETKHLAIAVTGSKNPQSWNVKAADADFYYLKAQVHNVLLRLGFNIDKCQKSDLQSETLHGLEYTFNQKSLVKYGLVSKSILKLFDIDSPVYFAEFNWDNVLATYKNNISFEALPKFPEVKRDLSMLMDEHITFEQIKQLAFNTEKKLLKSVNIFDVYQGKGIPAGKKSYAVTFVLQDMNDTLTDKKIEKIMQSLIGAYQHHLGAELR